ncbi:MAG: hypothetical protein IKZ58_03000 [Selenomonadaceae bacterium]|nr:hypothetical protein [Selenomonadaceae bacterium]
MAEIMPLNQIKSGMNGIGYTIIDNTGQIKPFNVEIVGVTENGKGSASMIMARASGDLIKQTGGVLQGMSGSPIYVDGKLIGALAIGYKEMSPYTFFITPIESMVRLWDLPDKRANDRLAQLTEKKDSEEEKSLIFFSGFDNNSLNFLKNELSPLGFKDFFAAPAAGSKTIIKHNASLVPGAAMGVAIVYGDFTVGATGTVTAVDNENILGFGHAFAHAGNVNFFMTDSSVLGSISGANGAGMRIASVGNIIGRINQDREAGISGVLGKFPTVVPISVRVKNNALNTDETYRASIAYNESLIPKLGAAITYAALSKSADCLEDSTVNISFNIKTNVTENGTISRQNMFYHDTDVGQVSIIEILQALTLICSNVTEESDIYDIEVNAEINGGRQSASLVSAVPDKKTVKPGETVRFTVTLQPYRKPTETIIIPYTIPITAREGNFTLNIHSGGLTQTTTNNSGSGIVPSTEPPAKEYERRIKNFLNMNSNNQIVIEPTANPSPKSEKERKAELERVQRAQERLKRLGKNTNVPPLQKFDSNYIIDNVIQASVNVGKI